MRLTAAGVTRCACLGLREDAEMATSEGDESTAMAAAAACEPAAAPVNAKKIKFPCLRCRKEVKKNTRSVRCSTCEYWVHADCEGMANELFNLLANPEKYGAAGGVRWNCVSCQLSADKIEKIVKNMEGKIQAVADRVSGTEAAVSGLGGRVDKLEKAKQNEEAVIDKKDQRVRSDILEEMRERECRRLNLVLYKVGECADEKATGAQRMSWDRQSVLNIAGELRVDMNEDTIKFCRRVGDKKDLPRPLVIGFHLEADRSNLLRRARDLEKTIFKDVSIVPDLTRLQRKEAEKRNDNRSEEDIAKNLEWAVVGTRGERRLVKTTARAQQANRWRRSCTSLVVVFM